MGVQPYEGTVLELTIYPIKSDGLRPTPTHQKQILSCAHTHTHAHTFAVIW